ncbi:MAG: glucose-6-phosphate isomerase [Pseudomonadota bacterium]
MPLINKTPEWAALESLSEAAAATPLRRRFSEDPARGEKYAVEAAGLYLDYSKNHFDQQTFDALVALAKAAELEAARKAMFSGEPINRTENRAVLHPALRDFSLRSYQVNGEDVSKAVARERQKIGAFVDAVSAGSIKGAKGDALDTVVNIGIGGSDLGPLMAVDALKPYWTEERRTFFVSNVDGRHLSDALEAIDPHRTLFVVASKTFTTQETMTNAASARAWLVEKTGDEKSVGAHFVALSTNERAVTDFGIGPDRMFRFWDWVGGRFSLWSAIGLSLALQIGHRNFDDMLRGAHLMDEHFREAPLEGNMPLILALMGVWNRNFLKMSGHAVLPYDQGLHRFPAYLQQAEMESNGKSVAMDGAALPYASAPTIFGEPGTNGQHAFYQLLHQGSDIIASDFIAPALSGAPLGDHHEKLLANFLAQPRALMIGKRLEDVSEEMKASGRTAAEIDALAPHKVFPGGRPSNTILLERLEPATLGALIALYEHKILCQGVIWGVNSFDQWGVELGKTLAKQVLPDIAPLNEEKAAVTAYDSSTNTLINRINKIRSENKSND